MNIYFHGQRNFVQLIGVFGKPLPIMQSSPQPKCPNKRKVSAGGRSSAEAFQQCGPGSIPGLNAIGGLSLLVLCSTPGDFSPRAPDRYFSSFDL